MENKERDLYNREHHYETWIRGLAHDQYPKEWGWAAQVFPTVEQGDTRLVAVDTADKLTAVAKALKNCAACYDKACAVADGLMVVCEKQNGEGVYKPLALCHYRPDGTIVEARITCNKTCPPTIRRLFMQHAKTWDTEKYNYLPKKIEELKREFPPLTEEEGESKVELAPRMYGPAGARYSVA
jgi:hypothetical protein